MINDQEYITTKLKKVLEKMLILKSTRLNNLVAVIIGTIVPRSVNVVNLRKYRKFNKKHLTIGKKMQPRYRY